MKIFNIIFLGSALALFSGCSQPNSPLTNNSQPTNQQSNSSAPSKQGAKIKPVTATGSEPGVTNQLLAKAIDGDTSTAWNAGGGAPQWIQLDLGQSSHISKVRLSVSQEPAGRTVHEIYGGPSPDKLTLIGTLDGTTKDDQWIELSTSTNDVRYLKVLTTISTGWISWREIEVFN